MILSFNYYLGTMGLALLRELGLRSWGVVKSLATPGDMGPGLHLRFKETGPKP